MNDIPTISRHLNILGCFAILLAIIFFVVFFNIKEMMDAAYFIGGCIYLLNYFNSFIRVFKNYRIT